MVKEFSIRKLLILSIISFSCGILARTFAVNSGKPDFVFYRTLEPQFALVAEATDN